MWIEQKGMVFLRLKNEGESLLELCSLASFSELDVLVEDLHRRRMSRGNGLDDFEYQERLKSVINLVSQNGKIEVPARGKICPPDHGLVTLLKKAGQTLEIKEPRGLLRDLLAKISFSWPQLLLLFGTVLRNLGSSKILGRGLRPLQEYLVLNKILYLILLGRLVLGSCKENSAKRFVLSDSELQRLLKDNGGLDFNKLVGSENNRFGTAKVPLLPLQSEDWLLSPEIIYDDLLKTYAQLVPAYQARLLRQNQEGLKVSESFRWGEGNK